MNYLCSMKDHLNIFLAKTKPEATLDFDAIVQNCVGMNINHRIDVCVYS